MGRAAKSPPSKIDIRALTAKDLPSARELWIRSSGIELAEGDSLPSLKVFLRRNRGTSFVALENGKVVGALLGGHDGRRGLLYHLAVCPTNRKAGIGTKLAGRSLAALKAKGIERVLLLVARDNRTGIKFWKKLGWESLAIARPMGINP